MSKQKKKDPTHAELLEILDYNEDTGIWTWLISPAWHIKAGDVAGSKNKDGYITIGINYKPHRANRLAWFYVYKVWPKGDVDHWNQIKHDNSLENLRDCSPSENMANRGKRKDNTSGLKGVHFDKAKEKWHAKIQHNGKTISLGRFDDRTEAGLAYDRAAEKYQGEYANSTSQKK